MIMYNQLQGFEDASKAASIIAGYLDAGLWVSAYNTSLNDLGRIQYITAHRPNNSLMAWIYGATEWQSIRCYEIRKTDGHSNFLNVDDIIPD